MNHRRRVIELALVIAACIAAGVFCMSARLRDASRGSAAALPVLCPPPSFSFADQDGHLVDNGALAGHVWIANFIFTQCKSACPMMTSRMVLLQRNLRSPQLRFVSFSVDPDHDTPAELKRYATTWHGDGARWRLLSTTKEGLHATAAGMHLAVQPSGVSDDPIIHSNRFVLVDARGVVRGTYDSSDPDEMQTRVTDADRLLAVPSPAAPRAASAEADSGEALYGQLGCRGCHDRASVAPPLEGLVGRRVELSDGTSRVVDEAYLRESIVAPESALAMGYGPSMPSYAEQVTEAQLSSLVAYVASLESSTPSQTAAKRVTDPVCNMEVTVVDDSLRAEHAGRTYFFCSDMCRQKFVANPGRYAKK